MSSFISRNGLAAIFFLGLILFSISSLVGSEGEDGLLMKVARDYTGEDVGRESGRAEAANNEQPAEAQPNRVETRRSTPASTTESTFYDDQDLIDTASGFDPTPDLASTDSDIESDEAMILPERSSRRSRRAAHAEREVADSDRRVVYDGDDEAEEPEEPE